MQTRPITVDEFIQIKNLLISGFKYNNKVFRPKPTIAFILQLQAALGLRIGDILNLKVSNFKSNKLNIIESKTNKRQYRDIDISIKNLVLDYALQNKLTPDSKLFNMTSRNVQKQLKIVCDYLNLDSISTHSFRKLFAVEAFSASGYNIELVRELLNHSTIAVSQRYINVSQDRINAVSISTSNKFINL